MTKSITLSDKVEHWKIEKLVPLTKINVMVHPKDQVEQIAASILEFGFTAPILVDDKAGILAGHGRLAAAKQLKLKVVPVIQLKHLSEVQRRAYMIADNKIPRAAQWDAKRLDKELKALAKTGFDILITGFSEHDIARLADDLDEMELRETSKGGGGGGGAGGGDASKDDDDDDSSPASKSSPPTDMVALNFVVSDKQRDFILEVLAQAKTQHKLKNNGDALVKICQQWKEQYDA